MATTNELVLYREANRPFGAEIVSASERAKSFLAARRHSRMVRQLRYALPAVIGVLVMSYIGIMLRMSGLSSSLPELALQRILPGDLSMQNPHYEGFWKDGSSYAFDAKIAKQNTSSPTLIDLESITARLTEANKSKTEMTATRGSFDHKASVLELFDAIDVVSESGLKARLTHATVTTKTSTIETKDPVTVEFPSGSLKSNAMTISQKSREIAFTGGVVAQLVPQQAEDKSATEPGHKATPGMFQTSSVPVDITSSRLDVRDAAKIAVFSGDVKAVQGDSVLSTPELEVGYDGGAVSSGNDQQTATSAAAGRVRSITAKAPVVMTRGSNERVESISAEFDVVSETGILQGNVVMTSGTDRKAVSDRVDLDQRANTALLTGNVVVTQGKNELRGKRLFVDNANSKALLTTPGMGGRIAARFYQTANPNKKPEQAPAASTPPNSGDLMGSFKTDPNAPIDIDAEQLEMLDSQKTAIFRGEVKAVQGDFVIRTTELVANYTGEAGLADAATSPIAGAGTSGKSPAQLTSIKARNKVSVTSKDGQEANGDWADYDAKANTVTVGGEVTLSKGQNMVRGTNLVIDMTTGESKLNTAPTGTVANPAGGGWVTKAPPATESPANRGRPSAVFFPSQLKGALGNKKARDSEHKDPETKSWDTETAPPAETGN